MRVLIVGCGYIGSQLGIELFRLGHEVFGMRRSHAGEVELSAAGIKPLTADVTRPAELEKLPGPFDWVVNCVSSNRGGAGEYRGVYLQGARNLVAWLPAASPKKFVHVSSTSVYGQTDGLPVKESSPTEPTGETGRLLVETENVLLSAAKDKKLPIVILRAAGIYGPGRGHLFLQYLKNEAKIPGRGERFINMIHRDDLAGALITALESGRGGEVYNAVDDEPVAHIHFFRWLSETLGRPMPPFATDDEVPMRKRAVTNKRVQNRRLKMELGYQFKYPNFRIGYTAEIQRLENAGVLEAGEPK